MLHNHDNMDVLESITQEDIDEIMSIKQDLIKIKNIIDTPPTYVKPTLTLSTIPLNVSLNEQEEINIRIKFTKNDAGNITNIVLKRDDDVIFEGTGINEFDDVVQVFEGEKITYTAIVSYADGVIKNSALGNPYPTGMIKAGTLTSKISVNVIVPSYYGIVKEFDIGSLIKFNNQSKNYTFNSIDLDDECFVYMYPNSYGELTSIKDGNNFEYINSYTKTNVEYNGIDYLVYILTDPITITGFKQIFS